MADESKNEFPFIKEKIKEKPLNKKNLIIKLAYTIGFAVVFGIVAAVSFAIVEPKVQEKIKDKNTPAVTIPQDEDTSGEETGSESEKNAEDPNSSDTGEPVQDTQPAEEQPHDWKTEDYKAIYKKLYEVAEESNRAIVTVTGVSSDVDWFNNSYDSPQGEASGMIISKTADEILILTKRDIIQSAERIMVTFQNSGQVEATLKKYDGNTGMAVITIPVDLISPSAMQEMQEAKLGNSYSIRQGDPIIAMGSPMGYANSISYGIITSVENTISTIDMDYKLITTDVLGSKNGSGMIVNLQGEVVGIIAPNYSGDSSNTVTAVAISEMKTMIEKLLNGQDIPYLGIKGKEVKPDIVQSQDLPKGVYVVEVIQDSPAVSAGIQNGDIIVNMNGKVIVTLRDMKNVIDASAIGQLTEITVMRQGKEKIQLKTELSALP